MCSGSITVEAVFLLPIILGLLLLTIWLALFLHDKIIVRAVMQQTVSSAGDFLVYGTLPEIGYLSKKNTIHRGMDYAIEASTGKEQERTENYVRLLLSDQLFLYQLDRVHFEKRGYQLSLEAEFSCTGEFLSLILPGTKQFVMEYREEMFFPVAEEITRAGNVLLEFAENIK